MIWSAQHVGFFQVLRGEQDRGAVGLQLADELPDADAAAWVQARRRLVEEQHRSDARPGSPPRRAGAACRPSTSSTAGRRHRRGRTVRASRPCACATRPCSGRRAGPTISTFSNPVRFSSTAALWPASPIRYRSSSASLTTSRPSTSARPPSGSSSVVRMRTVVVFPAPLGPSKPSTVPASTSRSMPFRASTSPKWRSSCFGTDDGSVGHEDRAYRLSEKRSARSYFPMLKTK